MANTNFLAGLGAALTEGSRLAGRARQERQQEEQLRFQREQELARMALQREQFDLTKKGFEADQTRDARGYAKDILTEAGPNAMLDPTASQAVEAGGFGFRLGQRQEGTLDSKPFVMDTVITGPDGQPGVMQTNSPGLAPGRQVIPTNDQQFAIDQQNKHRDLEITRKRAEQAISNPGFYKMPELNRAVVWKQAGFDGNPPQSLEEWKAREDYQQRQALQRIGASAAANNPQRIEWVLRPGPDGKPVPTPLRSTNELQPGDAPYDPVAARGGSQRPATGVQQKAVSTYTKLSTADKIMRQLESTPGALSESDLVIINNTPKWTPEIIKNIGLSENGQMYAQAQLAWGEGRLRDESGAAINAGEYDTDRRLASLQVGDQPKTIAQKRAYRRNLLNAFGSRAGRAFEDHFGYGFVPEADEAQQGNARIDPSNTNRLDAPAAGMTGGDIETEIDPQTGRLRRKRAQ